MFEWLANNLTFSSFCLQLYEHSKYLKLQIFDVWFTAPTSISTQASRTWLWRRIHRKLWSLVFWHSNCHRKTKCKVRLIKQVTSFVEGASIAHRKVRGYIFQERVGCELKQYNIYRHILMIKQMWCQPNDIEVFLLSYFCLII